MNSQPFHGTGSVRTSHQDLTKARLIKDDCVAAASQVLRLPVPHKFKLIDRLNFLQVPERMLREDRMLLLVRIAANERTGLLIAMAVGTPAIRTGAQNAARSGMLRSSRSPALVLSWTDALEETIQDARSRATR